MKAKYYHLRATLFFSALLFNAGAASAGVFGQCSTANAAGTWGYTITGTNTNALSPGADAIVGSGAVDVVGNVALKQTEVTNGNAVPETLTGKVKVGSDCTGTLTVDVKVSNQTITTATFALVFVDNQNEIRGILTNLSNVPSPPQPNQTQQLPAQTLNAKKLFPIGF
jgi:hypothetical protein